MNKIAKNSPEYLVEKSRVNRYPEMDRTLAPLNDSGKISKTYFTLKLIHLFEII